MIEPVVSTSKKGFFQYLFSWGKYLVILVVSLYILSGLYLIRTYETGILCLFGRVISDNICPGLHYRLPYPFTKLDKIRLQERKRISLGFEFSDQVMRRPVSPVQGEFISGDENILNLEMVIQYFIISPVEYLMRLDNPEAIIRSFTKSNLVKIVSHMLVDEILKGEGKVFIQSKVLQDTQQDLDRIMNLKRWVQITSVNLQKVSPPLEVADAFKDVVTARQDKDRFINEAEGYHYDALPKSRGKAAEILQQAEIYRLQKINQAKGDAQRFLKMSKEYSQKGEITSTRLYLETMEQVMGNIRKVFVQETQPQQPIDLSIIELEE